MSLRRNRVQASVALVLIGLLFGFQSVIGQSAQKEAASGVRVEGPLVNQNLAIYVVRGKVTDSRKYITLDEAMREKTVVLRELGTGSGQDRSQVNELEIQNKSDRWLYIQAGDVIQGGKQDRTIGTDVAIPPHSKPQPISAFCVEHGRWTPRSGGMAFESNTALLGSNKMKKSIQGEKNQSAVWAEVARQEAKASEMVTVTGESPALASATGTYNAIVQNSQIRGERADYVNALLPQLEKRSDAVGIVVAINGELTAADVYASSALFHKLARKLVESYALEALLARKQAGASAAPVPSKQAAVSFLTEVSQ
ncbi:MAG TPA: DUF6569 family protein, partial [Thermoanaerobaculia bacterium]|nr:DUF6569 family protein [Thermoanaerobaculia bacterium]